MKTLPENREFEFYYPGSDTLVQVEETNGRVVIRATRDTFSEPQQRAFVRELAAEGFISDDHQWERPSPAPESGVRWLIDRSWLRIGEAVRRRARRFVINLLVVAPVLWLLLMLLAAGGVLSRTPH